MSYSQKLKNPKWQRKRLEVMQRDGFRCTSCQSETIELNVHHIEYFEGLEPWQYPDDLLVTVCKKCHEKENERPKHETYLLQSLKVRGFLADDMLALSVMINTKASFLKLLKESIKQFRNG